MNREKALMLDCGRKFYTKEWILNLIDYMHELKMDTLQLHFSENEGFRIECETYPEIVSEDHLTKAEVRQIVDHATACGIQIIPDFDTPGHLRQILSHYPHFQLEKLEDGKMVKDLKALDITNLEAREFIKKIYQEYAELFHESKFFHIGADEFIDFDKVEEFPGLLEYSKKHYGENASGNEAYVEYTNEIAEYVEELGFTARVWNDGFYRKNRESLVELRPSIQVCYWTRCNINMAEPETFIEKGYQLINFCDSYLYYVLGECAGYTYPTEEKIRAGWTINRFPHKELGSNEMASVIGTSFAIWCDKPDAQTEAEVFAGISGPLKAMMDIILAG
jgi:hexosaminidase